MLSEPESGRLHSGHLLPVKVASHGWSISNIKVKRFWFLYFLGLAANSKLVKSFNLEPKTSVMSSVLQKKGFCNGCRSVFGVQHISV